ncbi:AAA family ATPase [Flavobacterium phragmitis]|uniref:Methyltransferase domain-containing protein n=1 Tax=Flavobacterium phragmitis TaxID=739143 RepID=A0A1I1RGD7_9FLAO|nr:AAA family ATPase [Flavobacterium phragmitis]SFD30653.1 Methyltransferase domain-containing protein [Flavobacterium phragmitis]
MKLKILELKLSDVQKSGLGEFYSTKFNSTIALVGKNGSGKTRYLKAIENYIRSCDVTTDYAKWFSNVPQSFFDMYSEYQKNKASFDIHKEFTSSQALYNNDPNNSAIKSRFNEASLKYNQILARTNSNIFQQLDRHTNTIKNEISKRLKVINSDDLRKLQESFTGDGKISFQTIIDSTLENVEVNEFNLIAESSLSFLQRLPHKLAFDEIDCRGDEKKFKTRVSYQRFELLKNLIKEFLDKDLKWHAKNSDISEHDDHVNIKATGYWTINEREFNYNDFSDGEKVLFTYAILLFLLNINPRIKFRESIIIIDEPELNLHPKAQIKLINTLENLVGEIGQIIIATHSLSIVANLDYGSIFLVRNNQLLTPSSSVPFNAIEDLMGFEEHYNKIVEFLVSTPSWAMTNFMGQCFEDPEVFESANKNDPQLEIFQKLILEKNNIRILDFGSGKGRLLDRIRENEESWKRIETYDCFDVDESFNELVSLKGASSIFNDLKNIPDNSYDLIIMVNVLHEIHVKHWKESLLKVKQSLSPNGYLAIIEDTELPVGELPNDLGFLLLDKDEMKILLGKEINFLSPAIERYKNRIICGIIDKENLNTVTKNHLIKCLEKLKDNSLKNIKEYRQLENKELGIGRLYALKSNLYVNSELAIEYLNNEISKPKSNP